MARFHINKHGVPAPCKAKSGNCPLGGDEKHYNSQEEAQEAADRDNEKEHGLLKGLDYQSSLEDDFNLIFTHDDGFDGNPFMLDIDSMEYLGYLDHTKNPDAIRKEFVDKFGEGSFIIQSEGENETVDMLEQGYTVDALAQRYNEIAQELKDEGYNAPLFDGNSDEYFETNEEFRAAYNQFLADRQGPEVEMYGVKLRAVESPHSEATKQFFKDYVQGNINEEVKSDFKNNIYDSIVNSTDNLSYVERIDDDYLNETLADAENPEAIKKVFYDNFEKGSLVAEIENDDPLSYSLNSRSDGVLRAYDEIQSEIQAEGNNPPLFDHESDEYFENNEDFKASYRKFLLEKQGPTKKIFGVNMAQIADPWGEETKNFFKNYINK